jgi:hypothetical protein
MKYPKIVIRDRKEDDPSDLIVDSGRLMEIKGGPDIVMESSPNTLLAWHADPNAKASMLAGKSLRLNAEFDWIIGRDEYGYPFLVPLFKEGKKL